MLLVLPAGVLLAPATAHAETAIKPTFAQWLEAVRIDARKRGVSEATLADALTGLEPNARILHQSENQTEFTTPFNEYRGYFVTPGMIEKGRNHLLEHRKLVNSLEEEYNVPGEILVAVWGVESRYGTHRSKHNALVALASLGYKHARNSGYFRRELLDTLEMLDNGELSLPLLGSWAGALGQPQFMPSSFREYAVDFDKDGKRDIWESTPDILGSIASYLSRHGWKADSPWVQRVEPSDENNSKPRVFTPDGADYRYRVYPNFDVLLKYNQSDFYALTVGILANKLQEDQG